MRGLLVVALVSAAFAVQQNPPAVFRSGADVVRFDLRVTDAAGRPITDLRPDEIEIVDDGSPRPILLFQHFEEPAEAYSEAALRSVSAEVSSNRGSPRGHLYVVVFDQAHITTGNEQVARRAAERFITEHVRPSDRVAIVGLPGPGPLTTFTADRGLAVSELAKVRGGLERNVTSANGQLTVDEAYEIAAGNDRVMTDVITRQALQAGNDVGGSSDPTAGRPLGRQKDSNGEDPAGVRHAVTENARTLVAQADAASRDFLQRLGDVLERYKNVEGRKTVLLFSEGFHSANIVRELEQVEAAAAGSYAVFCAFDLNRRAGADPAAAAPATTPSDAIQARLEPLGSLAADTDGVLIPDAPGHIDAALDRIAAQARDYYLIGFTPAAAALAAPGSYRHVNVRVSRPGARVSARAGYAVPKAGAALARRTAIDTALAAPFAQQGLRVEYSTYEMRGDDGGRSRVILSLEADLPLREGANSAADVVFVVRDMRDGRVVASGTDTMPLPAQTAGGASTGIGRYRVHFDVPPGSYIMRAVVREPGGLIGSADRRLAVRGFNGPDVTASDLIVDSPATPVPVRARVYTQDGLSAVLSVYGRSREQLRDLAVVATLVTADGGTAVATLRADTGEIVDAGGTVLTRRATIATPLAAVAPGGYVARVKVTAGGETVADLTREVDVVEGHAPAPAAPPAPELDPRAVLDSDYVKPARAALRGATTAAALQQAAGFERFERGDYLGAAADLAPAFAADQRNAPLAFVLGWAYEGSGDHRQAIGAWRAAATIDPKFLPAHLALAEAYLRISEDALAAQAVKAGLAALPDSPELQAKLAQIQKR